MPKIKINSVLDMRGFNCPTPMINVMNTLKSMRKRSNIASCMR